MKTIDYIQIIAHILLPIAFVVLFFVEGRVLGYVCLSVAWLLSAIILSPKYDWVRMWMDAHKHGVKLSKWSLLGGMPLNRIDTIIALIVVLAGPVYDYFVLTNGSFYSHDIVTWIVSYVGLSAMIVIWHKCNMENYEPTKSRMGTKSRVMNYAKKTAQIVVSVVYTSLYAELMYAAVYYLIDLIAYLPSPFFIIAFIVLILSLKLIMVITMPLRVLLNWPIVWAAKDNDIAKYAAYAILVYNVVVILIREWIAAKDNEAALVGYAAVAVLYAMLMLYCLYTFYLGERVRRIKKRYDIYEDIEDDE